MSGDQPIDVIRDAHYEKRTRNQVIRKRLDQVSKERWRAQISDTVELIQHHEQWNSTRNQMERPGSNIRGDVIYIEQLRHSLDRFTQVPRIFLIQEI
jgi:hypothetical protein